MPPLDETTATPIPWTQDTLVNYLIDGWDEDHGIAAGPMKPVVDDLYDQSEEDVYAIAAYVMSLKDGELPEDEQEAREDELRTFAGQVEWGHPANPPIPDDPVMQQGARVYQAQCANCHKVGGTTALLALTGSVNAPDAGNLIRIVFSGIEPPRGSSNRSMPARALQVNDQDMAAMAAFIRARFTRQPAWGEVSAKVDEARQALSTESQASVHERLCVYSHPATPLRSALRHWSCSPTLGGR